MVPYGLAGHRDEPQGPRDGQEVDRDEGLHDGGLRDATFFSLTFINDYINFNIKYINNIFKSNFGILEL